MSLALDIRWSVSKRAIPVQGTLDKLKRTTFVRVKHPLEIPNTTPIEIPYYYHVISEMSPFSLVSDNCARGMMRALNKKMSPQTTGRPFRV